MHPTKLQGIIPPMITPLKGDDELDREGAVRLTEHLVAGGAHAIFLLGTTGEAQSLTYRLRYEFVELVCRQVAGRVPVLVGVTDTAFIESIRLAEHAAKCGAVRDLAEVLAQNADINVMVEGHTDDVPYRPNGQLKDNLDLSAKRATTVVRLLLENKGIDPNRIIAAGRGESLPVDPAKTSEARAKNRRTEIILTPKLDELMQLMEKQ